MWESWNWQEWYQALEKPSWTPGASTISTIWTILYPIIFVTLIIVFYWGFKKKIPFLVVLPFLINILVNLAFTPILFGLKNLPLAALDILIVWITIVWGMVSIWPYSLVLALVQLPYLIWVSIATFLQFSITWFNR